MLTLNEKKKLPQRQLRFSKKMVAVSLGLIAAGLALIMRTSKFGMLVGVVACGLGLAILFTAGYFWGCDNESCT